MAAASCRRLRPVQVAISSITGAELSSGKSGSSRDRPALDRILAPLDILPFEGRWGSSTPSRSVGDGVPRHRDDSFKVLKVGFGAPLGRRLSRGPALEHLDLAHLVQGERDAWAAEAGTPEVQRVEEGKQLFKECAGLARVAYPQSHGDMCEREGSHVWTLDLTRRRERHIRVGVGTCTRDFLQSPVADLGVRDPGRVASDSAVVHRVRSGDPASPASGPVCDDLSHGERAEVRVLHLVGKQASSFAIVWHDRGVPPFQWTGESCGPAIPCPPSTRGVRRLRCGAAE
jgi:hypothetical protein